MQKPDRSGEMERRRFLALLSRGALGAAAGADLLALMGCGGGSGSGTPGGTTPGLGVTIATSPNGPAASAIQMVAGGQTVTQPAASGSFTVPAPTNGTLTIFATEGDSSTPLLFAIVPPSAVTRARDTGSPMGVTPSTTVQGLLFFLLSGGVLPVDSQMAFLNLIDGQAAVQTATTTFANAYQQDGRVLARLSQDSTLVASLQNAANAVASAIVSSGLAVQFEAVFGTSSSGAANSRDIVATPTSAGGINLSIIGQGASASNNKAIYRWAQTSNAQNSDLGWVLLPDDGSPIPLKPNPLPLDSPVTLTVTGGVQNINGSVDLAHGLALGVTLALNIVIPIVAAVIGVSKSLHFDPSSFDFGPGGYHSQHPFLDELLKIALWDPKNSVVFPGNPLSSLIKDLAVVVQSQQLDLPATLHLISTWFFHDLAPALVSDARPLATAALSEWGGSLAIGAVIKDLAILASPWFLGFIDAVQIGVALQKAVPATMDLFTTPWTSTFQISQLGDVGGTIQ